MTLLPGKLSKKQRETVTLLQMGTFLEYCGLFLYVHMAGMLNDLFFPQTDSRTQLLLHGFAFSNMYLLRPLGMVIFGYLGDYHGRKKAVFYTACLMAVSCVVIAILPVYEKIGLAAAVTVTLCRLLQGMSTAGEIIGAEIYLTETVKGNIKYYLVSMCGVMASLGAVAALGIAALSTSIGFDWRMAFWMTASITAIGASARTKIPESAEYADFLKGAGLCGMPASKAEKTEAVKKLRLYSEKINKNVILCHFCIQCGFPFFFYFVYVHCGQLLSLRFSYTPRDIIIHTLAVAVCELLSRLLLTRLALYVPPLRLLRYKIALCVISIIIFAVSYPNVTTPLQLLSLQALMIVFAVTDEPAAPVFYKYMPVFKRFRCAGLNFSLARSLMYVIASLVGLQQFDLPFLQGHALITSGFIVSVVLFSLGMRYFTKREAETGSKI